MSKQRWEVWYSGYVQGVGFRYTTCAIARGFDVTGYVQNMSDGRVHLVAEGDSTQVIAFLDEVEHRMNQFVREVKKDKTDPTGEFITFDVRF